MWSGTGEYRRRLGRLLLGGGFDNTASQFVDTVAGGLGNTASGGYSFAAGDGAQAINEGAFVWADSSSGAHFTSTANNQFSVRANGGVRFVTGGAGMTIDGVPVGGGGGSASNAWLLTGNAGANPAAGYFLGTSDMNGLELHVNGERGMRLDYAVEVLGFLGNDSGINVNDGYWGNSISNGIVGATIAGGGDESQVSLQFFSNPNTVGGDYGTVGGGHGNSADFEATVPGGYNNTASGNGSFAAGRNAKAGYSGNFVWSDGTATVQGSGANSFSMLRGATGEMHLETGGAGLTVDGQPVVASGGSIPSMQVFDTPGQVQFVVPAGVTKLMIEVWGGGGGGGEGYPDYNSPNEANGSGGGAGGYGKGVYNVTAGTGYTVVVGAGGGSDSRGGTSSVGSLISATGGAGGANEIYILGDSYTGSVGGTSSAPINITGGSGVFLNIAEVHGSGGSAGCGGSGGVGFVYSSPPDVDAYPEPGHVPGGGGSGGESSSEYYDGSGAPGGHGRVVIYY